MAAEDQTDRSTSVRSQDDAEARNDADVARAKRLRELISEHGWPTPAMVGEEGSRSAWLIAQHADFDVEFQVEVLALMRADRSSLEALRSEVALLTDRVAVNRGLDQTYGTQGSCVNGRWVPREMAGPNRVDERRAEIGLEPLDRYLARFEDACDR